MPRVLPVIVLGLLTRYARAGDSRPRFGGPTCSGMSDSSGLPLTWSETENIVWKTAIQGHGWSSPVIRGGRLRQRQRHRHVP